MFGHKTGRRGGGVGVRLAALRFSFPSWPRGEGRPPPARQKHRKSAVLVDRPTKKESMMDLTTVDHLLTTTRSVRKRLDLARPVEPEVIERCLELATQAPSGSDRQSWHFVVITDPDLRM